MLRRHWRRPRQTAIPTAVQMPFESQRGSGYPVMSAGRHARRWRSFALRRASPRVGMTSRRSRIWRRRRGYQKSAPRSTSSTRSTPTTSLLRDLIGHAGKIRFYTDEDGALLAGFKTAFADLIQAEKVDRSEEHTSELQSLMRISYAVFCLKKKIHTTTI